jgi:regulator of RNase E activity RraB
MPQLTNTYQVTFDLYNHLKENNYYYGEQETICNQKILTLWDTKFRSALAADIKSKFENVEIDFEYSEFELESEDDRGACVFFQKIVISDKINSEFIKAFVKTLVNYNKTTIYLDSSYANIDKWQGESEQLNIMFNQLKTADKELNYFSPISLADFLN